MLLHIILGIGCFAAGGVCVLMFQGSTLKAAIATEIGALKTDIADIKGKIDPAAQPPAPKAAATGQSAGP